MRVIVFSDLHAHNWQEFSEPVEYEGRTVNSRLLDAIRVIDQVREYAAANGIHHVVFGGDLYHRKRTLDVGVVALVSGALYRLADSLGVGGSLALLPGNHDVMRQDGVDSALESLKGHPKTAIVEAPQALWGVFGAVPWAIPSDAYRDALKALARRCRCVCVHVGVDGARTGPLEYRPREPITLRDLPRNVPIYSGHYHYPQAMKQGKHKIVYVGSPLMLDRGDRQHSKRGFIVVDTDTPEKYTRVAVKGPGIVKIVAESGVLNDEVVAAGNFVDLEIRTRDVDVQRETQRLLDAGARYVNPVYAIPPVVREARLRNLKKSTGLPTLWELCEGYVEEADDRLDKSRLLEIAKAALSEAEE